MTPSDVITQPVKVLQDDSGHWYIIPVTKHQRWIELNNKIDLAPTHDEELELISQFEKEFAEYRTGGDINNRQLFAQL